MVEPDTDLGLASELEIMLIRCLKKCISRETLNFRTPPSSDSGGGGYSLALLRFFIQKFTMPPPGGYYFSWLDFSKCRYFS